MSPFERLPKNIAHVAVLKWKSYLPLFNEIFQLQVTNRNLDWSRQLDTYMQLLRFRINSIVSDIFEYTNRSLKADGKYLLTQNKVAQISLYLNRLKLNS